MSTAESKVIWEQADTGGPTLDKPLPIIGVDPLDPKYEGAYNLKISLFIDILDPPKTFNMPKLDPNRYYITSGDAIRKTSQLIKDIYKYAGEARKKLKSLEQTPEEVEFEKKSWEAAGKAQKLMKELEKTRGKNIFLETDRSQGSLIVVAKNPRSALAP